MAHVSFVAASKLVELLMAANTNRDMYVRVLTANKLALGTEPLHPTKVIDLSKEEIQSIIPDNFGMPDVNPEPASKLQPRKASRQSGTYLLEFDDRTIECTSLKQLLSEGLKVLESARPGTLQKLSQFKKRTKRIVAREPSMLFGQSELADKYSERLVDGWWFGTNNSSSETQTWLKRACSIAGLEWGTHFNTSL